MHALRLILVLSLSLLLAPSLFAADPPPETAAPPKDPAPASPPPKPAPPPKTPWESTLTDLDKKGIDVVIVFDSTGSMGRSINALKAGLLQLTSTVKSLVPDARFGLVTYRDKKQYDLDFQYLVKSIPLTRDLASLEKWLAPIEAYSGGDAPEAVFEGLQTAITKEGWRPGTAKVIIIFGDAPIHPEDNGLQKTYNLAKSWHLGTGGVISCIATAGDHQSVSKTVLDQFNQIAANGGGESAPVDNKKGLAKQLTVFIFGSTWQTQVEETFDSLSPKT